MTADTENIERRRRETIVVGAVEDDIVDDVGVQCRCIGAGVSRFELRGVWLDWFEVATLQILLPICYCYYVDVS